MSDGALEIRRGGLDDPRVVALLEHHVRLARATSPPCSAHALDLDGLRAEEIAFFSGWQDGSLAAVGALKRLSGSDGEIKSMHTAEAVRGRGAGAAMLAHLIDHARRTGLARVSLETGVQGYFAPAVRLYRRFGFEVCPPFGAYKPDPNSLFMTRPLDA